MPIALLEIKAFGLEDTAAMTAAFEKALKPGSRRRAQSMPAASLE
jgi:hypothetical protein